MTQIYDNFEMSPNILVGYSDEGTPLLEFTLESEVEPEDIYCWAVYGHLPIGGLVTIADFETKDEAEYVFNALMKAYIK